jgi:hypothetical protein
MPAVGFEPTIPAGPRPQTYALDGAATGIGWKNNERHKYGSIKYLMKNKGRIGMEVTTPVSDGIHIDICTYGGTETDRPGGV